MKGIPTLSRNRLKRAAAVAGVGALVLGGALLGTTQAHAAVTPALFGTGTGLTITPATGTSTTTETYSSAACPTGFQGSAQIEAIDPTTPAGTAKGSINDDLMAQNTSVATTFTGTITSDLTNEAANIGVADGQQFEVGVFCFTAANETGAGEWASGTFATLANGGTTYTADQTLVQPSQSVNLTLTANPNPATSGQSVTLTATASVAGATGTVTFLNGTTSLGTAPLSGGSASLPFTAPTETAAANVALTATYNPTGSFTAGTAGALSLPVNPQPAGTATGSIPLAVTVPLSGTFTLSVNSTTWVVLGVNTAGTTGTAATTPIVVTDTYNSYPGWSVTGEATQWNGVTNTTTQTPSGYPAATDIPADHGSQHMAADDLGWMPTNTGTLPTGVTLGGTIAPDTTTNGLGDAFQPLATGAPGAGSFTGAGGVTLGANLTLAIPAGQEEGPYAAFLNIDAMTGTP
jgi:hypothetical protein